MINDINPLIIYHIYLFCLKIVTISIAHSTEQQKSAKLGGGGGGGGICNMTLANPRMEKFRFRQQQKKSAHFLLAQFFNINDGEMYTMLVYSVMLFTQF